MTDALARPESLNRYAYVLDNPATLADPSGNFIVWQDCFLDSLFPECQCDPENGCPPKLFLLRPGTPLFGRVVVDLSCARLHPGPQFAHSAYLCAGVDTGTVTVGQHCLRLTALI
ncbi:MAG TPA: hypothetical protein VGS20_14330 [Candidatus Acidoferrales bacterium]|nr:hypothetical protein [Candidatus Acidoferrales bacterium]